jgi:hypothetical protein
MRFPIPLLLLLIAALRLPAAVSAPDWVWALTVPAGSTYIVPVGPNSPKNIAVDGAGSIYMVSGYSGSGVSFGLGLTVSNGTHLIAKFTPDGNCVWVRNMAGAFGAQLSIDGQTNIIVAGVILDGQTLSLDTGSAVFTTNTPGLAKPFVAKYAPDGNLNWARIIAVRQSVMHELDNGRPQVACDNANNIYVAATYTGWPAFSTNVSLHSASASDIFIAKFSPDGNFQWASNVASQVEILNGFKVDNQGSLYLCGAYNEYGSATHPAFFQSVMLTNANPPGGPDGYVAKLDSLAGIIWARRIGSTGDDRARALGIGTNGHVHVAGEFGATVTLEQNFTLTNAGYRDAFAVEYDSDGELTRVHSIRGTGEEFAHAIDVAPDGGVVVGGFFGFPFNGSPGKEAIFGEGESQTVLHVAENLPGHLTPEDIFIARYEPDGNLAWAVRAGGPGYDSALALVIDPQGNCIASGVFDNSGATNGRASFPNPREDISFPGSATWLAKLKVLPKLTQVTVNGPHVDLTISGPKNTIVALQSSTNLTSWEPIYSAALFGTNMSLRHTNGALSNHRFYQLTSP